MIPRLTACLVPFLVAGCLGQGQPAIAPEEPLEYNPTMMSLRDCTITAARMDIPTKAFPVQPYESWGDPLLPGISQLVWSLLVCEHLNWGPFSRGPVLLAEERHSRVAPPESCLPSGLAFMYAMTAVIFNDEEIAAYAQKVGLPAHYAEIGFEANPLPGGQALTWTIDTSQDHIQFDFVFDEAGTDSGASVLGRSYFAYHDGVAYGDARAFNATFQHQALLGSAVGTLAPPSAAYAGGLERFVGTAIHSAGGSVERQFGAFEDWQCSKETEFGANNTHSGGDVV